MCSQDVAQPLTTVRTCPREVAMAVPLAGAAKAVTCRGCKRFATRFRVAGVALCDIATCFITCQKPFCATGAMLLRRFQKMTFMFRCGRSIMLLGMRSTLDV